MRSILILLAAVFAFSKNVLILNSYSVQFPWTKGELEGILYNLKERKDIKIYIEFMDTKLFSPSSTYLNNFYNYLKIKYKNVPFDIVITTDDNALHFVLANKDFFKKAKIFFAGVNNLSIANKIDRNKFTGVFEKKEPLSNLELLKKTIKKLKKVYVVADNSNSAKAVMKEYKNAFRNIQNLEFIYINDNDLKNVLQKIKDYKNSGMLLLTPFSFKLNSHHINYKKAIKLLSQNYKMPIVIHTDILASLPDNNIIGGKVTDAFSQGFSVSKKVLLYLNGEQIKNIPLTYEKANKMYINVNNLKKFNVDIKNLPYKNAVYVNKPLSVFEMYKKYIVVTGIILFVLIVFIIILLIKNYKLRKYSDKIVQSNEDLEREIKRKFNEFSQNYSEFLRIKKDAIIYLLKFVLKNVKIILYDMAKKDECQKNVEFVESLIVFCEDSFNNSEKFSVKNQIEKIAEILNRVKFYNIFVKGNDFFVNLDKILFVEMMIQFLKPNCEVNIENNLIKIKYFENMPEELDKLKENLRKKLNIETEILENQVILSF